METKLPKEQQKAARLIRKYKNDIIAFVDEVILNPYNRETGNNYFITRQQREALIGIADLVHKKRNGEAQDILGVSIMAGKGNGKDALASWVILWFMTCFPYPKIPCVSVSADQLNKVLWSEMSKWHSNSGIKDDYVLQTDKFFIKNIKAEVRGKEWFAFTKAANPKSSPDEQVETLAGQHSDYLLQIVDEGCHDDQTEILTDKGWKLFKNLDKTEKVLSMHPETMDAYYVKPLSYYKKYYSGEMYKYKTRRMNFNVSPWHKFFCKSDRSKYDYNFRKIKDFPRYSRIRIPKGFNWTGIEQKNFTIKGQEYFRKADNISKNLIIDMDLWLEFLGWYLSEGNLGKSKWGYCSVHISQKKEENRKEIKELLDKLNFNYFETKNGYSIPSKRLAQNLIECGLNFKEKKIPNYIRTLSQHQIRIFINAFLKGDGYINKRNMTFYTSSPYLAGDIQELLFKLGYVSTCTTRDFTNIRKWIINHWAKSSCINYVITATTSKRKKVIKTNELKKEYYEGMIYCAEVPDHLLFTRRKGKCMWSGNSGVLDPVYTTLENNMTGYCNLMLLIFNPMHAKGYAVDTQYKNKDKWVTFRWNSEESEIVNQDKIRKMADDYGKDSNTYRMNVLGLPPLFDETTLINWDWILSAIDRNLEILPDTPLVQAVDCGAGGDKSIIASRRGNKILPYKRKKTADSNELVNWIGANIDIELPDTVRVDTIGIGWAVEGALRQKKGAIIEAADTRRQADNSERFVNKRAEMYWNLRDLFEKGTIEIPDDNDLKDQLAATKYEIDAKGRIKIIEKKKIKAEIGHSPDELDATAILYYYPDSMISKKFRNRLRLVKTKGTWMAA